jgi:hypothetical protein
MRHDPPPPVRVATDAVELMTQPDTDAVIVFLGRRTVSGLMMLFNGPYAAGALIDERTLQGRHYWCAVFPNVPPGEASVNWLGAYDEARATLTVEAGRVTRMDWRWGRARNRGPGPHARPQQPPLWPDQAGRRPRAGPP